MDEKVTYTDCELRYIDRGTILRGPVKVAPVVSLFFLLRPRFSNETESLLVYAFPRADSDKLNPPGIFNSVYDPEGAYP